MVKGIFPRRRGKKRRFSRKKKRKRRPSIKAMIKREIMKTAESKTTFLTVATSRPDTTWKQTLIRPVIPEGAGTDDRIGRQIRMRMLKLNYLLIGTSDPASVQSDLLTRIVIFWQKDPGQAPVLPVNWTVQGVKMQENPGMFLMYDRFHLTAPRRLVNTLTNTSNRTHVLKHLKFNLKNRFWKYSDSGTRLDGHMSMWVVGASAPAAIENPFLDVGVEWYWKDP